MTATAREGSGAAGDPYLPRVFEVRSIEPQAPQVATFTLAATDSSRDLPFAFQPGQFNMIYLPGLGEVAISISGDPDGREGLKHTIRFIGRVTEALSRLEPGALLGVRGPYGAPWPLDQAAGRDVLLVAGGLGMAPLRPVVKALLHEPSRYGRLSLVYGGRQPIDLLFAAEFAGWRDQGLQLRPIVDRAGPGWRGEVGVAPALVHQIKLEPANTLVMTCGPEIMMHYTIAEVLAKGVPGQNIFLSLERNMQCAVGLCGHCQLGPEFLCVDGPVFPYPRVARYLGVAHF